MNFNTNLLTVILAIVLVMFILQVATLYTATDIPTIPHCREDELVIGWGDYSQGYYEDYLCRAVDDIVP